MLSVTKPFNEWNILRILPVPCLVNVQSPRRQDILALREESKILGHCWDVLKVVTCLQSSLWASPHRPTQCSKAGLKMSDMEM